MMQTDLFTDTLIQLMREVFAPQAISSEQRARIYTRIASNRSGGTVELMDFWGTSTMSSGESVIEDTPETNEADQLWLFPDFATQRKTIESTPFSLPL